MRIQTPMPGTSRRNSRPPGSERGIVARMRGDELIADLFEVMHDLHFLRDAIEGADFCLTLAMEKMPCRAGLVHLYDIDRREFVITCARGPGTESLLLRRYPEHDPVLRAAMRKQRAIVIADARSGDAANAERYRAVGGVKSAVVAPVALAGRFLGAIELFDPSDGAPFTDNEGHATSYIGEQFAEFVATRGVLLDPERIAPPKPAAAR
jgi:GAF domain-containing protein